MPFRVRGFLLHLLASFLLALLAICIVFLVWYPSPLQQAVGVTDIFLMLLGIDVVIGPLLTLAVCKEGKKSLKFDLAIIVTLQLSAFFYGVHTIAEGRPVWIAFNDDRFDVIRAFEMDHIYRTNAKGEYKGLSLTGPKWVAVRQPTEADQKTISDGLFLGVDIPQRADFYEPYANQKNRVIEKARDIKELAQFNNAEVLKKELSKWPQANAFLPLKAGAQFITVLLKRETGEVVAITPLASLK